ncbi:tryptophan synthase subunit alpha [Blattabacterium cuenoti]|uniref:tryptophan synthase subunit alpha n=1 Tax=Blattabacterium cuenoti TaxID=1653831 RepID=UPI00163B8565|nr:tryptophan synthase subunit alpha [Blattabacterium cuenoti]
MNLLNKLFNNKNNNILCIYFTAGYPTIESVEKILLTLQQVKVDVIEIGIPYSDPIADGLIIQKSNQIALQNGMNISLLFSIINKIKKYINVPIIIMGYYNQFYKYGEDLFLQNCKFYGISGLIIPDLPVNVFLKKYKNLFKRYSVSMIFLITSETNNKRLIILNQLTDSFLYIVGSNSITGKKITISQQQINFFKRIKKILKNTPKLIGFGIQNKNEFKLACKYANGGIIGSSFIQAINKDKLEISISEYIKSIR